MGLADHDQDGVSVLSFDRVNRLCVQVPRSGREHVARGVLGLLGLRPQRLATGAVRRIREEPRGIVQRARSCRQP